MDVFQCLVPSSVAALCAFHSGTWFGAQYVLSPVPPFSLHVNFICVAYNIFHITAFLFL